jgi:hypothetical protein
VVQRCLMGAGSETWPPIETGTDRCGPMLWTDRIFPRRSGTRWTWRFRGRRPTVGRTHARRRWVSWACSARWPPRAPLSSPSTTRSGWTPHHSGRSNSRRAGFRPRSDLTTQGFPGPALDRRLRGVRGDPGILLGAGSAQVGRPDGIALAAALALAFVAFERQPRHRVKIFGTALAAGILIGDTIVPGAARAGSGRNPRPLDWSLPHCPARAPSR